jgi:hypothetical protein
MDRTAASRTTDPQILKELGCHGDRGFVCPRCGSHHWTTTKYPPDLDTTVKVTKASPDFGVCRDQYSRGCHFQWRRDDLAKEDELFQERCTCPVHLGKPPEAQGNP